MPETNSWVRVKDKDTGHKLSVRKSELPHGNYDVLKSDAVDPMTGLVVGPEFHQTADTGTTKEKPNG